VSVRYSSARGLPALLPLDVLSQLKRSWTPGLALAGRVGGGEPTISRRIFSRHADWRLRVAPVMTAAIRSKRKRPRPSRADPLLVVSCCARGPVTLGGGRRCEHPPALAEYAPADYVQLA
jgi:hypothetical protein